MRTIKFRAWDKKEKEMLTEDSMPFEFGILMDGNIFDLEGDGRDIDDFVIMFFTDLKDRRGKEIYEGDIVRFSDEEGRENVVIAKISKEGLREIEEAVYYSGKVIGNIYENPELF